MLLGYNTNGFAHHRLEDALTILREIGYGAVAITIDYGALNPYAPDAAVELEQTALLLRRLGLRSVVETGARFLLDPRRKHHPTLLSATADERIRRVEFLKRAVDVAVSLRSDAVSFWSGSAVDAAPADQLWTRLLDGCGAVLEYARGRAMPLAFEPEPGMFVEYMGQFERLVTEMGPDPLFGLTLDVGHVHCLNDGSIPEVISRWGSSLLNVHIEDMRRGVHDHLMFGEGEIDFSPLFASLHAIGYAGGAYVELSRHSFDAVAAAQRSYRFLCRCG